MNCETSTVGKQDDTSKAIVRAARELFARWGPQGKDAGLFVVVNPISRLSYRRWVIIEGFDLRVGCERKPVPEGLVLGGQRALLFIVRERRPFSTDWTEVQDVDSAVVSINRQLTEWTANSP